MQSLDTTTPRNAQLSVLARKRANATLKPFIGDLKGWNMKAAQLRARASSAYSTDEDRTLARLEGGALLAEIRHRQSDFKSAIKGEPAHDRFDDVSAAFERLIDQLQAMTGESGGRPTTRGLGRLPA